MKKIYQLLLLLSVVLGIYACTRTEVINQIEYVDVIVDGNEAPPYSSITTIQIQGYVNRMFIDLIGREPSSNERDQITQYLKTNELSTAARDNVLSQLMSSQEYYNRFYTVYVDEYLDGITSQQISGLIILFDQLKNDAHSTGNTVLASYYQAELNRLITLNTILQDYQSNTITLNQFFATLINNPIYDDINMGSENFVNACFEGLFKRLPTEAELNASVTMVDGFSAQLLLQDGSSKDDFINIVTTIDEFYQGLVIDVYNQLLARSPNSQEMGEGTVELATTTNYQLFQRKIMTTDEYAGF